MKIIREYYSEDCFDGNFIKEYELDEAVSREWILSLKPFGRLTYLSSLENPFYSFDKKYFFTIKGIQGERKIKVIFRRNNMDITMPFLDSLISSPDKEETVKQEQQLLSIIS